MSAPKDQTIGQVVGEVKPWLAKAAPTLDQAKAALDNFIGSVATDTPSGSQAHTAAVALKASLDSGIGQGEAAVEAIQKLLQQFAFPISLVGGVKVQGSGQLSAAGASAFEGIQSAMTQAQKYITIGVLVAQCVVMCAGVVLTFFPQIGLYGLGGGLTVTKVIGLLGTYLNVKNARYPDAPAPRAELVAVPLKP